MKKPPTPTKVGSKLLALLGLFVLLREVYQKLVKPIYYGLPKKMFMFRLFGRSFLIHLISLKA